MGQTRLQETTEERLRGGAAHKLGLDSARAHDRGDPSRAAPLRRLEPQIALQLLHATVRRMLTRAVECSTVRPRRVLV